MRLDASPANERLVAQSHEWSVKVHRILETPSSLVAFGVRADTPVVLKVVSGWHEEWNAGKVVAAFAGHGMVRALEHVPGAVLLEELRPGTPLSELVHSGLAIDPKGVVAEPEFELAAVLRNPHSIPDLYTGSALARRGRQLAGGLGLDLERVLGWTFAQAVLSAIWSIEDGEVLQPDAPILGLARAARSLLA
jgi:streptomycin 6-kinase